MEQEQPAAADEETRGHGLTGVARSQNAMYVLPHDPAAIPEFLLPALARVDPAVEELQLLVLVPDPDSALEIARAAVHSEAGQSLRIIPLSGVQRAARLLRARPATTVIGAPAEFLELIRTSALKLDTVRAIVIAWADALVAEGGSAALESVLTEAPKDVPRIVVTAELTEGVEQLVERYARRARRVGDVAPVEGAPVDIRYIAVTPSSRAVTLRRLLDELDPEVATIFVRTASAEREAVELVTSLGYASADELVRVTRGGLTAEAGLLVLYELPATRDELLRLRGSAGVSVVAFAQPRQIGALGRLAGEGRVSSLTLMGASTRARSREQALRDELRTMLELGPPAREMVALEPLLADFDGLEIAGAALRLLEHTRGQPTPALGARAEATRDGVASWTRLFISGGTRDNITAGAIVGAIANEAGIPGSMVGKVELRENHALVEVASEVAEKVVEKLTGTSIRGRRVVARVERQTPAGAGREGGSASRERGAPDRGARDRGPRGAGGPGGGRGDRAGGARGGPPSGARSERPRGPREDRPSGPRRDRPSGPRRDS